VPELDDQRPPGPPRVAAPQSVVFDLDGVIASGDTMAALIRRRLLSNPIRALVGAVPAVAWTVLRRFPRIRVRISRALGSIALSGLTSERYATLARQVGGELGADPAWVLTAGLEAIRRHLDAGDSVVVTTGTEALLSRAFLDALGLDGVGLIGTSVRFGRLRACYSNHNLGDRKAANLAGREVDLFYTDSDLDLSVAGLSGRTVLVNPDIRTERHFRDQVADVTVVSWA